ncbi:MAG TPA: amidohydrolase family protein [Trebonia sp.]|nr:amidohydrolase family protein [Trebonia sp.]
MRIRGAIPTRGQPDGVVTVEAGVITDVSPAAAGSDPPFSGTILPGLLDIHCHGGGGHTFSTFDPDEALAAAAYHASCGTTGVVASLVTAAPEDLLRQVRALAPLVADGRLLGIHLEGPFLSPARRGAHSPALLRDPDPALTRDLLEAGGGAIKIVTLAPERTGATAVARMLREAGVVVAFGHSDADYAVFAAALADAGGSALITHLGNAMPPLGHRAAGPVAAALVAAASDEASVELISDGVHVDAGFTRLVFSAAAPGRVVLVTDAMAAAGMPDGTYQLGPLRVRVRHGVARLAPDDEGTELGDPSVDELAGGAGPEPGAGVPSAAGAIAGGTSNLLHVVATAAAAGVPLADAVRAASQAPARVLGRADRGPLAPGMTADLVVTDENLAPVRVLRAGRWLD